MRYCRRFSQLLGFEDITTTRTTFINNLKGTSIGAILHRRPSAHDGTCTWFIDHAFFKEWLEPFAAPVLCVWGRPGVGKTIMMKYLNDYFRESFQSRSGTQNIIALSFCDDKDARRRERGPLHCSLMDQVLDQNPTLIRHLNDLDTKDFNSALRKEGTNRLSETSVDF